MPQVTSKDGTEIAYTTSGQGPAIILIDGAMGFRAFGSSLELAKLIDEDFTVYSYDRRGRGVSGDTKPYTLAREVEDIEALITQAGDTARLYGVSSGGALALEAAYALPEKVVKAAVYEIPYDDSQAGVSAWQTYCSKLKEALKAGKRDEAVRIFMQFVGTPDDMISNMQTLPFWRTFEAVAPTLLYDAVVLGKDRTVPKKRFSQLRIPVLVMEGGGSIKSMPFMRATAEALTSAIPKAQHEVLEGQRHNVDITIVAPLIKKFYR